jgi:oligopeptide/dipeptide ABC transporter ATP-binding protein
MTNSQLSTFNFQLNKPPLLSVENLTSVYMEDRRALVAVEDLTFSVNHGETIAIVGESGCGKTAAALSIARLIEHSGGKITGGRILLDGEDLVIKSKREMRRVNGRRISMIFQEPMTSLNPLLTVGYQLTEILKQNADVASARDRAVEMLCTVGVDNAGMRMKSYPFQLSGGQRQRIMIAMALCNQPDLLIADEPTTALDVTIQAQILDLIRKINENMHMSVLLITHDLGIVAEMASRVVVMYAGQLVELGETADIFNRPLHPYTRGLLKAVPKVSGGRQRLYIIPGTVPSAYEYSEGCRFFSRCDNCDEICAKEPPPLLNIGSGQVRCHHAT